MKILPVITEKSVANAKIGKYSFWVPVSLTKNQIRELVGQVFGVHVKTVATVTFKSGTRRNMRGQRVSYAASKKAIVSLKEGEKIDLFEEPKKKKAKKEAKSK